LEKQILFSYIFENCRENIKCARFFQLTHFILHSLLFRLGWIGYNKLDKKEKDRL